MGQARDKGDEMEKMSTLTIRKTLAAWRDEWGYMPGRYGIYRDEQLVGRIYAEGGNTRHKHWTAISVDAHGRPLRQVQTDFGARAENGWKGRGFFVLRAWVLAHPEEFPGGDSA